jgi:hypothetical protein
VTDKHPGADASEDELVKFCQARRAISEASLEFWMTNCFP